MFHLKDEYALKIIKVFKLKSTMQPLEWEGLFKKEFFQISPQILKKTKYVVAIADPNLGIDWWR